MNCMEQNNKDWIGYLDLYGADTSRWPVTLSYEQKNVIKAMSGYAQAFDIDRSLDNVTWPDLSANIKDIVMSRIEKIEDKKNSFGSLERTSGFVVLVTRPAMFLSVLVLFLCLGVSLGSTYGANSRIQTEYSYFSYGAAYAYASAVDQIEGAGYENRQ